MAEENKILVRMLERLFASMVNGPLLNCRPHASRQRIDLSALSRLKDIAPDEVMRRLLGPDRSATISAKVPPAPKRRKGNGNGNNGDAAVDPQVLAAEEAWAAQQTILNKLRIVVEDARTYEQDTGVYILNIGFPLLSMPPGTFAAQRGAATRRVIAPLALIPIALTTRAGATPSIQIACKSEGIDLVMPNTALLAWLERQTGKEVPELFADEEGDDPWREISELVKQACSMLEMPLPDIFGPAAPKPPADPSSPQTQATPPATGLGALQLVPAPRADDDQDKPAIFMSAVLGLFPTSNQGLLRDMQALAGGEAVAGPIESFIRAGVNLDQPAPESQPAPAGKQRRQFNDERLVTLADPCQSRAVKLARESRGLVIHGPPGTGKSQTIANIIGDHLFRGQRILMVCDKRTALDVVANRLDHLGLGTLCALVHDPQRDQRELYRAIRDQLDALPEIQTNGRAETRLAKVDAELQELHDQLTATRDALMESDGSQAFHDLVGQWLALSFTSGLSIDEPPLHAITLEQLEKHAQDLHDLLQRGLDVNWAANPWTEAAGLELREFLARPMNGVRASVAASHDAAAKADATIDRSIPPFLPDVALAAQAKARVELADRLEEVNSKVDPSIRSRWAAKNDQVLQRAVQRLAEIESAVATFRYGPLDAELALGARSQLPNMAELSQQIGAMEAYLPIASKWYAFLAFKRKGAAAKVAARYGLPLDPASALRLRNFLVGLRARLVIQAVHDELFTDSPTGGLMNDEALENALVAHTKVIHLLSKTRTEPALAGLAASTSAALVDTLAATTLTAGLRKSVARADALSRLEDSLSSAKLFDPHWSKTFISGIRGGAEALPTISALHEQIDTLDPVLRNRQSLSMLPPPLSNASRQLLRQSAGTEEGIRLIRRAVLAGQVTRKLESSAALQSVDAQRMKSSFDRYRKLDAEKKQLIRDAILHRWVSRQKERLLASTGSRLNSMGADLRRRLTLRGEKAMRLRQVIAIGRSIEGGDPLFDVCPVWMASPETVAQLFPRLSLFDVVVFDEASQCRLEEALPVLLRAGRVVIAGDPKQLPPTRFFESAVATSEDEEVETDQQLFEIQQGEVEDLLGAALNLSIDQSYLDVHYRSRNADLIEFSNEYFYSSRLQPIPAHPANRAQFPPLTLYRVNGVYEDRENVAEAEQVVKIVKDLLRRAKPPSIGIACFNIQQRDLILEKLDDAAAEDEEFASRLADARQRTGANSFEGLFVKNLENVQGDERDHMIISTTYGPDPKGRFYRRFGPLGRAGGGRRLNVLVTRAREEVHLVTSIPAEAWRSLPPVPQGQAATGGYLLFAYLDYAEKLAAAYEQARKDATEEAAPAEAVAPKVVVHPSRCPSPFAEALARVLAEKHRTGSDVHWGNEGFGIDLALHHPASSDDVTVGILCDGSRFAGAQDPVEWDIFRTAIHESQGWKLHRLWTPHFFRDPEGAINAILKDAAAVAAKRRDKDAIRVT